jgi:dihydroorotate dehydrogenase electron transfer subunit
VSLEAHMACGLGYCHGCSSGAPGLAEEAPLVCRDGPVFRCSASAMVASPAA